MSSINHLVHLITSEKRFQFPTNEIKDYKLLEESELITVHNDIATIAISTQLTSQLIKHYSKEFRFTQNSDFLKTFSFYQKIEKDFDSSTVIVRISEQMQNILSQLILVSNQKYGETFIDFVKSNNSDSTHYYRFTTSFSEVLPQLVIPIATLEELIRNIYNNLFKDVQYNLDLGEFLIGIKKYSQHNPSKGLLLFNRFRKKDSIPEILGNLLGGLFNNHPSSEIERLRNISSKPDNAFIVLMCIKVCDLEGDTIHDLFNLLDSLDSPQNLFLLNRASAYVRLLQSGLLSANERKTCFDRLKSFLLSKNDDIIFTTLNQILFIKGYEYKKLTLIKHFTKVDAENKFLNGICTIISRMNSPKYFFDFLRAYQKVKPNDFQITQFQIPINSLVRKNKSEFDDHLIQFLIDDVGGVRLFGKRTFSHLTLHGSYRLDFDLKNLNQLEQIKLIVSLLTERPEPKKVIPTIVDIKKSEYPLVVEFLLSQIELYIEVFSSTVINTLEDCLDLDDPADQLIYERIKKANSKFIALLDKKSKIKEFDPSLTHARLFKKFNENYFEYMSRDMQKTVDNESVFLNMVQKVQLAKGGGWKYGDKEEVSQLSVVSSSFQFPRTYYINPERFDIETRSSYVENWKNEFKEWESVISSSENT